MNAAGWWGWVQVKYIAKRVRDGDYTRPGDLTRLRNVAERVNPDKRRCLYNACRAAMGKEAADELFRGLAMPMPEEEVKP